MQRRRAVAGAPAAQASRGLAGGGAIRPPSGLCGVRRVDCPTEERSGDVLLSREPVVVSAVRSRRWGRQPH